jgi:uncharacterized protein (DUF1330 family)
MAKGYWIVRMDVNDRDGFAPYLAATPAALAKYGGRFLVRAGRYEVVEGATRSRNTVVEFPSYEAALACWNSPEYQAARALRLPAATADLVVVEGYDPPAVS